MIDNPVKPIKSKDHTDNLNNDALAVNDSSTSLLGFIELILSMDNEVIDDKKAFLFSKKILGLDRRDMKSINDPKKYLNSLLKIIIGNTGPTEETQTNIYFSDSKDGIADSYYNDNNFPPSNKRIYAAFDMNNYFESSVIAKWTDPSGEPIIFNKYDIDPFKNTNHIWLQMDNWEVGKYQVDYYRTSNLELIGSNTFSIQH